MAVTEDVVDGIRLRVMIGTDSNDDGGSTATAIRGCGYRVGSRGVRKSTCWCAASTGFGQRMSGPTTWATGARAGRAVPAHGGQRRRDRAQCHVAHPEI
jgi:hypothetical protein